MADKKICPSCGEECEPDEICTCPECDRPGCSYCMQVEKRCVCPECEEEEDE